MAVAVVKATPNHLSNSKAQLWDLHSLSVLVMVKDKVIVVVTVTVTVKDSPSTTS
jgi:nitrate reductase NapAB chaperone NapD